MKNASLRELHFRFVLLANAAVFLFYLFYRIFMAIHLVFGSGLNFFTGALHYHERGYPHYTLWRAFLPVFLLAFVWWLCLFLFRGQGTAQARALLRRVLHFSRPELGRYLRFLGIALLILALVPGFFMLLAHPRTQYGYMDIDSYVSLISLMWHGDYNAPYAPEGGLQFGKYYHLTMPTLILTFLLGIGKVVTAFNITVTALVFFTIVNIAFIFCALVCRKDDPPHREALALASIGALIIAAMRATVFRDYFNYDAILVTYSSGFYGALGAAFLYSGIIYALTYLFRHEPEAFLPFFLVAAGVTSMLVQSYFNLVLFLLPSTGLLLGLVMAQKSALKVTLKLAVLYLAYIGATVAGFAAIDIFPRYNIRPLEKLALISAGSGVFFLACVLLNRYAANLAARMTRRFSGPAAIALFLFPFIWYYLYYREPTRIDIFGYPLKLGDTRIYLFSLLVWTLAAGYLLFGGLGPLFLHRIGKAGASLAAAGILACAVIFGRVYEPRRALPFVYPEFYPAERRIMDRANPYVFDENGIRVTYNGSLVDAIDYFARNRVNSFYYWIVSKTPANGVYEHGLIQRVMMNGRGEVEGITVRGRGVSAEPVPDWGRIQLAGEVVEDYEGFTDNIVKVAAQTEALRRRFASRYVILDKNAPARTLEEINASPLFERAYANALYTIYRVR